ncbi:tripartite tricarboxylate transporter permease [bacterium]|nr:tripartite tricarboxylate transporter permease [bacterium]
MEFNFFSILFYSILGTLIASILSLIPALHIYNVIGVIILLYLKFGAIIPREVLPFLLMSMVVTYAILNTIPSIFLGAPDDSTIFVVLPGQKYLLLGKGYEAAILTGFGSLMGIFFLVLLTPLTFNLLPLVKQVISPHLFWILGLIVVYILMSEWPKGTERAPTTWGRFFEAWRGLGAGLLTFLLSGFLGLIVFNKSLVPLQSSFQGIMPVFVGLFAIPWVLLNLLSEKPIPRQHICSSIDFNADLTLRGTLAGSFGGLIAALFPIVTGGVGGLLAGHATAQRDERIFVFSQGVAKSVYYVGAFLFFFVPAGRLGKGGLVAMLGPVYSSYTSQEYFLAIAVMLFSAGIAFLMLIQYSKFIISLIGKVNYQIISGIVLAILFIIVFLFAGWIGIFISTVSAAIGLIPVLFGSRRLNCMGVLLVPITLNMAGLGPKIASALGIF